MKKLSSLFALHNLFSSHENVGLIFWVFFHFLGSQHKKKIQGKIRLEKEAEGTLFYTTENNLSKENLISALWLGHPPCGITWFLISQGVKHFPH